MQRATAPRSTAQRRRQQRPPSAWLWPGLWRWALWLACALGLALPARAQSVVFINPGHHDEAYWVSAARAMEAAARSLGIRFDNHFAQRQHLQALELARRLAARPAGQRPDYVVFSNDYGTAPEMLRILQAAGIRSFMAFSGVQQPNGTQSLCVPRGRYPGWLGSLEPRADEAGYQTARQLIATARRAGAQAPDGKLYMLVLAGDRSTPSSVHRLQGLERAVQEAGDVVVAQTVYADWRVDRAASKSAWLYARYPHARLVWSGNDLMAWGAMQAWERRGGVPGKDAWFSAINTSPEALQRLQSGRLAALSGGHFLAGAWALVMLYDYHHGRDFAADEGVVLQQPMFTAFTPASAALFAQRFGADDFSRIDFRRYSKVLNPALRRYDFRFEPLLAAARAP